VADIPPCRSNCQEPWIASWGAGTTNRRSEIFTICVTSSNWVCWTVPNPRREGPHSSEWVGRCLVQPNRKRGDNGGGACANCCGEQRAALVVQDSVASAPRFDVGEHDDDEASLSTWVRTKPTAGRLHHFRSAGAVAETPVRRNTAPAPSAGGTPWRSAGRRPASCRRRCRQSWLGGGRHPRVGAGDACVAVRVGR
jgi:hypothetical protein